MAEIRASSTSSNRPLLHPDYVEAPAGQATNSGTDTDAPAQPKAAIREDLEQYESGSGATEETNGPPTTSRKELWSYYLYYNGDNGVGPRGYSQALFQSALTSVGHDPRIQPPRPGNCTTGPCVVPWGHTTRSVGSVVLIANGLCFAVMSISFVWLGSAADYGFFGPRLLLVLTILCWVFQYAFMAVKGADEWRSAMALFIVSYIAYGSTLVFYAAIFPRSARYMPHVREAREEKSRYGKISQAEYDRVESLERNHISSISTAHSNIGYLSTLIINLGVLLPSRDYPYAKNWALFMTNTYWICTGVWWFLFQQNRPGPKLPKDSSYLTIGWKQVVLSLREVRHLPQTFIYLVAFFLLADGSNTTGTLLAIIQNDHIGFSFSHLTYLGLAQAACSTISTFAFWYIQRHLQASTKSMFMVTNFFTVLVPFYGMLGLWTNKVGFHQTYDFWIFNVVVGLFQAPYYAYSQTMMSEVIPTGYENMFFGLFGITNRASSVIGPYVIQAIINDTNNNWLGFPFLFAICFLASVIICFVDVEKGREDCRRFIEVRKVSHVAQNATIS